MKVCFCFLFSLLFCSPSFEFMVFVSHLHSSMYSLFVPLSFLHYCFFFVVVVVVLSSFSVSPQLGSSFFFLYFLCVCVFFFFFKTSDYTTREKLGSETDLLLF